MADYDIGAAFAAIEEELISSMVRNLSRHRAEETAEGIQWPQWQAQQLEALAEYRKANKNRFKGRFSTANRQLREAIRAAYTDGGTAQEREILEAIEQGFSARNQSDSLGAGFFTTNRRKLDALVNATTNDVKKAETAVLRRANDQYRKIIFNAQVYANTGAGTYEKAVDMATKDFLSAGLQCVVYANGSRHTLSDYADMALRTASKRAYLAGEGTKRQEWGVTTVILNKRSNACPKCARFCGKVFIDDAWSGGTARDGPYPLLSSAIRQGLYHPRCKDSHTTYFPGITEEPRPWSRDELKKLGRREQAEQQQQHARRQAEKYRRLEQFSLDGENERKYGARAQEWEKEALRQAEAEAASMGVQADYNGFNPKLARAVNQSIADVQGMFGVLTRLKGVQEYTGTRKSYALFNFQDDLLCLKNVGVSDIMEQMAKDTMEQFQFGGWSTGDPRHAIVHEIGHAIEKQYLTPEVEAELEPLRRAELLRVTGNANTDIEKELKNKNGLLPEWGKKAKTDLSLYGLCSTKEMVAESVAQNILGEPGNLAQNVILILMR